MHENYFSFFGLSFIFGGAGAWMVYRFSHHVGLVDVPSARSSHSVSTPKGGGIGILVSFVSICVWLEMDLLFWGPAVFVALLSFLGDRSHLNPGIRLMVHFLAATVVVQGLHLWQYYEELILLVTYWERTISLSIGLFLLIFIAGTANFYNFMDGIDGIAAITGVIGFSLLALFGVIEGKEQDLVIICCIVSSACMGFLPFNLPKARVFMGDIGSVLLGFIFAVIVVKFAETQTEFIVLSCFLFPFYADELVTMVERIRLRHSLIKPHRRHLYQVLANEAGVAHWKVSLGYGLLQVVVGACVWQASRLGLASVLFMLVLFGAVFIVVNNRVKREFCIGVEKRMFK